MSGTDAAKGVDYGDQIIDVDLPVAIDISGAGRGTVGADRAIAQE